jgi:hypothetical protein
VFDPYGRGGERSTDVADSRSRRTRASTTVSVCSTRFRWFSSRVDAPRVGADQRIPVSQSILLVTGEPSVTDTAVSGQRGNGPSVTIRSVY